MRTNYDRPIRSYPPNLGLGTVHKPPSARGILAPSSPSRKSGRIEVAVAISYHPTVAKIIQSDSEAQRKPVLRARVSGELSVEGKWMSFSRRCKGTDRVVLKFHRISDS